VEVKGNGRQDFSAGRIVEAVRAHVGGVPAGARVRACRTGKFNSTFFVERDEEEDLVIRIAPPDGTGVLFYERKMMAQEPELHRLLLERTTIPVPRILAYDTTRRVLDRDFLIMERMPGTALTEAALPARDGVSGVFRQVGSYLAQAHAITTDAYGYLGAHRCMAPQRTWWEAFRVMWGKLIDDTVRCGGYDARESTQLRAMLDRYRPAFDRAVPSSLLHMDIWHQNILVDESGKVTAILDWDRALWGDPEIEFAVLDYCGVSVPEFWEGYGRERQRTPEAAIRNRFYLLYEVQKYILISICRRKSRAQAERYREMVFSLARSL